MKTEIYLIRHAEPIKYEFLNDEDKQIANKKTPLSIDGEKSAEKLFKSVFLMMLIW